MIICNQNIGKTNYFNAKIKNDSKKVQSVSEVDPGGETRSRHSGSPSITRSLTLNKPNKINIKKKTNMW